MNATLNGLFPLWFSEPSWSLNGLGCKRCGRGAQNLSIFPFSLGIVGFLNFFSTLFQHAQRHFARLASLPFFPNPLLLSSAPCASLSSLFPLFFLFIYSPPEHRRGPIFGSSMMLGGWEKIADWSSIDTTFISLADFFFLFFLFFSNSFIGYSIDTSHVTLCNVTFCLWA